MMKIDLGKLPFVDFEVLHRGGYITDGEVEAAKAASGSDFTYDFWQLTLKDLSFIMEGQLPDRIIELFRDENISTVEFFRRNSAFEKFMTQFCEIIDQMSLRQTPDEVKAAATLPKFIRHEGFLVFARDYFGLKSFSEAENVTLGDIYLAKKDVFAKRMFERNLHDLISRKKR